MKKYSHTVKGQLDRSFVMSLLCCALKWAVSHQISVILLILKPNPLKGGTTCNMAPHTFPLGPEKKRQEQYLFCVCMLRWWWWWWGGTSPSLSFHRFFLHLTLLSDADWIGLETGGAETQAALMKMTMHHPPCLGIEMHLFAPLTRAYVTRREKRKNDRAACQCLVQVCWNNWKGKTWIPNFQRTNKENAFQSGEVYHMNVWFTGRRRADIMRCFAVGDFTGWNCDI